MHIIEFRTGVRNTYVWGFSHICMLVKPQPSARMRQPISYPFLLKLSASADCKMCARLQISFVFLHILARETVLHFMRHSPVASLLAVGASKALSLVAPIGKTSLSPNPIDQPYAVWIRTSLSSLDHEQKGVPAPLYSQPLSERPIVRRLDTATSWRPLGSFAAPLDTLDNVSLQAPLDPKTKLTPFGLR